MNGRLAGKTALITAAGQGMGYAVARAMAGEGAIVYATDVNDKLLERFAGAPGISGRKLDVLDDAAVAKLVGGLPPLQVLFNCAGFVHHGTILDCEPKDWEFSMNLNVRSMYTVTRAVLPGMLKQFQGTGVWSSIINMASIAGSIRGLPNRFVYGTSKAAVIGLTKSVALETAQTGVTCNAICPGWVLTPLVQQQVDARAARDKLDQDDAKRALLEEKQPSLQFVTAVQLGALAVFLCTPAADQIRGAAWNVDGGWYAQ